MREGLVRGSGLEREDEGSIKTAYQKCIEAVFSEKYVKGAKEVAFTLDDITRKDSELGLEIANLPDVTYSFRSNRFELPDSVKRLAPEGHAWLIRGTGKGKYLAVAVPYDEAFVTYDKRLLPIKVPDATPGIVKLYTRTDEQALLARIRYNRLVDVFTGVVCYSLQNHYRTFVKGWGQVETDELYVGVDRAGVQYAFPVQAKGVGESLGRTQIEQDFAIGKQKPEFRNAVWRPLGAQFIENNIVVLYEFAEQDGKIWKARERHYLLVPPDQISEAELRAYRAQSPKADATG